MKKILIIAVLLITSIGFSQNTEVKIEKKGDLTEVTYFHDNGEVAQQGTFNLDGKLHGLWTSYDLNGEKISVGNYEKGQKTGKWFFWSDNSLNEVDYTNNAIVSVNAWTNSSKLAVKN